MNLAPTISVRPAGRSVHAGVAPGPRRFSALPQSARFAQRQHKTQLSLASGSKRDAEVTVAQDPAESPFLEPFLRSLLLGLGTAVLLESAHETMQLLDLAGAAGGVLEAVRALPPPLIFADHVAAITGWVGFYLIEAVAIAAVIKKYAGDQAAAAPAISSLVTLPKKMLPLRLQLLKQIMLGGGSAALAGASTAAAATTAPSTTSAASSSPPTTSAFVTDSEAGQATAVLPKAQYPPTLPLLKRRQQEVAPPSMRAPGTPTGGSNIVPAPTAEGGLMERRKRQNLKPGEWDPDSAAHARREKELMARQGYLLNFWYCAALSEAVPADKPHSVHMFGKQMVLFRNKDGSISCLDDTCPHRGAPLSGGWLTEVDGHSCVVCPYHGWALDTEGCVQDVPAAVSRGEWPKRSIVPSYPVEERGGFVWLFYGSKDLPADERPPIPFVPELEDPSWKPVYGEIEFDCNHHGVFENAIDMAHIHYLHGDTFGNQEQPQIKDMQTVSDAFSVTASFSLHNKPVSVLWEWCQTPESEVHITARAMLPSTSVISFTLGNGLSFTTFVNTVPVSATKAVNRFALVRNLSWDGSGVFNAGAWDSMARNAMFRILGEDKLMVERLRPDLLPQEYSVRADLPQIAFRKLRQQWVDMGSFEPNEVDAKNLDRPTGRGTDL